MHNAPTVEYPLGRSPFENRLLYALWSSVACVYALWFFYAGAADWRPWLGLAFALAAVLLARSAGQARTAGRLVWDGRSWNWISAGASTLGKVAMQLDLQRVMLLRFETDAGTGRWFWLDQSAAPARWQALRRAIHAKTPGDSSADSSTGAAGVNKR